MVSVFLLIAALGAFLIGLGESWNTVLIGRVLIGLGLGAIYIPMLKVLAVWFKKNEFASLNGIILAVGNAGAIASATPLAILSDAIGWQDVFIFLAITTLILAVMCYVIIRNHPSEKGYMSIEEIISNEYDLQQKINKLFKSNDFIYKKKFKIKTKDYEREYTIISKSYDYLLCIDGTKIYIKDIIDIK